MCLYPRTITNPNTGQLMDVACGKCFECLYRYSNEWAFRCMLEASQYKANCFITLTFNDENIPEPPVVTKYDVQKFLKRLRKKVGSFRYRLCGEYGSKRGRPHYHILIFGWRPDDLVFFKRDRKGSFLYRSAVIESCWKLGFSSVADVTFESARYVSKYMQKLQWQKDDPIFEAFPAFTTQSLKPGIGLRGFDRACVIGDKIFYHGKYIKVPRYFLKKIIDQNFDGVVQILKAKRMENASNYVTKISLLEYKRKKFKNSNKTIDKY